MTIPVGMPGAGSRLLGGVAAFRWQKKRRAFQLVLAVMLVQQQPGRTDEEHKSQNDICQPAEQMEIFLQNYKLSRRKV